jgi:hypothetical protein
MKPQRNSLLVPSKPGIPVEPRPRISSRRRRPSCRHGSRRIQAGWHRAEPAAEPAADAANGLGQRDGGLPRIGGAAGPADAGEGLARDDRVGDEAAAAVALTNKSRRRDGGREGVSDEW